MEPRLVSGRKGLYAIAISNLGNTPRTVVVEATDPEETLHYSLSTPSVQVGKLDVRYLARPESLGIVVAWGDGRIEHEMEVPPNSFVLLPMLVVPRRAVKTGREHPFQFEVIVHPSGVEWEPSERRQVMGQLIYRPRFAAWVGLPMLVRSMVSLGLVLFVIGALVFFFLQLQNRDNSGNSGLADATRTAVALATSGVGGVTRTAIAQITPGNIRGSTTTTPGIALATAAGSPVAPDMDSAILTWLESNMTDPYKDVNVKVVKQDDAFATLEIHALIRKTEASDWEDNIAIFKLKNVANAWRIDEPGEFALPKKTVAFLQGHGERNPFSSADNEYSSVGASLEKEGYYLINWNLVTSPTSTLVDVTVLVIAAPQTALTTREAQAVQSYLDSGGHVLITVDPTMSAEALKPIANILENYGVTTVSGIVLDAPIYILHEPTSIIVNSYQDSDITRDLLLYTRLTVRPINDGAASIEAFASALATVGYGDSHVQVSTTTLGKSITMDIPRIDGMPDDQREQERSKIAHALIQANLVPGNLITETISSALTETISLTPTAAAAKSTITPMVPPVEKTLSIWRIDGSSVIDDYWVPIVFPGAMGLMAPTSSVGSLIVTSIIRSSSVSGQSWLKTDLQNQTSTFDAGKDIGRADHIGDHDWPTGKRYRYYHAHHEGQACSLFRCGFRKQQHCKAIPI